MEGPHVENNVCSNVIYRTVSAISVSIPPVRHALVTTVELKYLDCRHSNVRIGGIRDNNGTFYMGNFINIVPLGKVRSIRNLCTITLDKSLCI